MVELVDLIPELRQQLEAVAQPDKAPHMKAYMKDHFAYLGRSSTPERERAAKSFVAAGRDATAASCSPQLMRVGPSPSVSSSTWPPDLLQPLERASSSPTRCHVSSG